MSIQSIRIRNFRSLRDIHVRRLPKFAVLVGPHGCGKSTFIDVFAFLRDCITRDVRFAIKKRGGFNAVVSRGYETESILIEFKIKLDAFDSGKEQIVTYHMEIAFDGENVSVSREFIKLRQMGHLGPPGRIFDFRHGYSKALKKNSNIHNSNILHNDIDKFVMSGPGRLAIRILSGLDEFKVAKKICDFLEDVKFSHLDIPGVKQEVKLEHAEHLSETGTNLPAYTQYLKKSYPCIFQDVIKRMALRVPGIFDVSVKNTTGGRVGLEFHLKTFERPFLANSMSDGTVKMFAFLALLADPKPNSVLCVEEPEYQIYPSLLSMLAEEFEIYSKNSVGKGQVIVTTQSFEFLNGVPLTSVLCLRKLDGFAELMCPSDDEFVQALSEAGDPPGWLWIQGAFRGVSPI